MPAIYLSEVAEDDPLWKLAKGYRLGDSIRVAKVTLTKNDADDTKAAFLKALGEVWEIKEITLWENTDGSYHTTYEIEVDSLDTIFLNEDEIELIHPR